MKNRRKWIIISTLGIFIALVGIGTYSYFRRNVNGDITGQTGNLKLLVNDIDAETTQNFSISLNRSEEEPFILPDDKGSFDINIDASGSISDVVLTLKIERINLPDNLKFYVNNKYEKEITDLTTVIEKSNAMTKTITIHWFWDGSIDDENDIEFMNKEISANVVVSSIGKKTIYLYDALKESARLDTNIDFSLESSSTNGKGLMMLNATQNDVYPVVYYRGDVSNNNVIYAGYCWLIVRTTETGGIKLIYNGEVNSDGSCNNYSGVGGNDANQDYLGAYINRTESAYNAKYSSPVYVGYMYNDNNTYFNGAGSSGTLDSQAYLKHLEDNTLDSNKGRHTQNLKNSDLKEIIDNWYMNNLEDTLFENLIEDTIWCNDRSVTTTNYKFENYGVNLKGVFSGYTRNVEFLEHNELKLIPNLQCSRTVDRFTVSDSIGNGDLEYPIGLLTVDESIIVGNIHYADNIVTTYISLPERYFWLMSPHSFGRGTASMFSIYFGGLDYFNVPSRSQGVKPSISLNNSVKILLGNGSFSTPYVVG